MLLKLSEHQDVESIEDHFYICPTTATTTTAAAGLPAENARSYASISEVYAAHKLQSQKRQ